ncbi:MAG: zinc-binding dehydrogenase [Deltaproteobacteria bacterium]|nr:zinc-binding dehydrogenase [Deltaproteobacteria bacterium]
MGAKGRLFDLVALLAAGKVRPVIDRTLPLAAAATAQRLLEERQVFDKVVLEP